MKNSILVLWAAAAAIAPSSAAAQSQCEPEFLQSSQTVTVLAVDIGSSAYTIENFDLRLRNGSKANGGGSCATTLRLARLSTSPTIDLIAYTLQSRGKSLEILPSETAPGTAASDLRLANLPTGSNGLNLPFQLGVPSDWGTTSGRRTDDLLVMLVDATGTVVDTLNLTIVVDVAPAAEVRVVGATGLDSIAQLDLGVLDPTATTVSDPFGIRVWTNSPYTVRFVSQNLGKLVHEEDRGRISYELLMNSAPVSVTGGIATSVPRVTTALGDYHPLQVRVAPFSARAGSYSDRVEVTVTAN